tara:strand:+ start:259 stop:426 length:168 start_codon:yes stop_codon:yes gene_type:complete
MMPPGEHHHLLAELDFSIIREYYLAALGRIESLKSERGKSEVFKPARTTIDLEEF